MVINKDTLQTLYTDLRAEFTRGFGAAPTSWDKIAMKVDSRNPYRYAPNGLTVVKVSWI